ncbi:MAG: peptidylprolyl isomerase [Candidatus Omnitrophota bacterium]
MREKSFIKTIGGVFSLLLFFNVIVCFQQARAEKLLIQNGRRVSFDYTLTVEGEVIDSSEKDSPLEYVHGKGQIISGLEKRLEGLKVGDKKTITVTPEEGYGIVNPQAITEVPRRSLPKDLELKEGRYLQVQTSRGGILPAKIIEVKDDTVSLDVNHPLAGKTLNFKIKIVSIE